MTQLKLCCAYYVARRYPARPSPRQSQVCHGRSTPQHHLGIGAQPSATKISMMVYYVVDSVVASDASDMLLETVKAHTSEDQIIFNGTRY
jgi:hypothetical protein